MIVEILGAKMLSPYVGTSHFVWTAQIAVTLVALACGYYAGGRWVDAAQKLARLYGAILAAALYLALTILACEPVAYWCLDLNLGRDFSLAAGTLCASTILFFVPLALLAMTGPFLVRMITASVEGVGSNVGRLSSISTLGSFAGTMLIGYVLIPFLPNSLTMGLTAAVLVVVCVGYFVGWHRRGAAPGLVTAAVALALAGWAGTRPPTATSHTVQLYRGNSHFGLLQVLQAKESSRRYYLNDYLTQNIYDPEEKKSTALFTYMLSGLARAYTSNLTAALCIGLGIGIVPMELANQGVQVDVVEINPAVVPLATKFFDLKPDKLNLTIGDGRYFLNRSRKQYDTVILDAFLGEASPSHLMTVEAFRAIQRVLRPGGTLVINSFGDLEAGHDFFTASLHKTLQAVFAKVRIHTSGNGNIFFVAADRPELKILHPQDLDSVHSAVRYVAEAAYAGLVDTNPEHGRVLTDNYNPVEFYDAKNREGIRRSLALAMRNL